MTIKDHLDLNLEMETILTCWFNGTSDRIAQTEHYFIKKKTTTLLTVNGLKFWVVEGCCSRDYEVIHVFHVRQFYSHAKEYKVDLFTPF